VFIKKRRQGKFSLLKNLSWLWLLTQQSLVFHNFTGEKRAFNSISISVEETFPFYFLIFPIAVLIFKQPEFPIP